MPSNPIYDEDRPTPYQAEIALLRPNTPCGLPGHTGYRCAHCARKSPESVQVQPSSADYWQQLQIDWQEEVDKIMQRFDGEVATHFPQHQPVNCTSCPVVPALPPKPNPPGERRRATKFVPDTP